MHNENYAENTAVALRTRLRQARAALPEDARSRGALLMRARLFTWSNLAREALAEAGQPLKCIAAFWPMADEPDLRPLLEQWVLAGYEVCLPVIAQRNAPLEFRRWTPEAVMREGAYGIAEPADGAVVQPDVILVPTLGYTLAADRLGYGGGYYDRTLAALHDNGVDPITIGVAWTEGLLPDDYAPAAHDFPLDAILTPEGWVPDAPLGTGGTAQGSAGVQRFLLN